MLTIVKGAKGNGVYQVRRRMLLTRMQMRTASAAAVNISFSRVPRGGFPAVSAFGRAGLQAAFLPGPALGGGASRPGAPGGDGLQAIGGGTPEN